MALAQAPQGTRLFAMSITALVAGLLLLAAAIGAWRGAGAGISLASLVLGAGTYVMLGSLLSKLAFLRAPRFYSVPWGGTHIDALAIGIGILTWSLPWWLLLRWRRRQARPRADH